MSLADDLLVAFSPKKENVQSKWAGLRAYLHLAFRAERDGVLELGRRIAERALADVDQVLTDIALLTDLPDLAPPRALPRAELYETSRRLRMLATSQAPEVRSSIVEEALDLATGLAEDGTPAEEKRAAIEAVQRILDTWSSVTTRVEGLTTLLERLEALTPLDMQMAFQAASWLESETLATRGEQREGVRNSLLAGAVLARLRDRQLVPDLAVYSGTAVWDGPCTPAHVRALQSGPFRSIEAVCDVVTAVTTQPGYPAEVLTIPPPAARPLFTFTLGPTDPTGRYILPIAAGIYTIELAAAFLPGATVTLTFAADAYGQVGILASDVANAINLTGLPGLTASVVAYGSSASRKTVEVVCTGAVSGPSGWAKFYSPSDPLLWDMGFPPVRVSSQWLWSAAAAEAITLQASRLYATGQTKDLLRGLYARFSAATPSYVFLAKGVLASCTPSGNRVLLEHPVLNRAQAGDECWLKTNAGATMAHVVSVEFDGITVDTTVDPGVHWVTVNPPLPTKYDTGVGYVLEIGGRWYVFATADWKTAPGTYETYVSLGNKGPYEEVTDAPFRVLQDILTLHSRDSSPASYLEVTGGSFATAAGFPVAPAYAEADRVSGPWTAQDGFSSRVRPGDLITGWSGTTVITAVEDGALEFSPARAVGSATITIQNVNRSVWDTAIAALALPTLDEPVVQGYLEQIQRSWDRPSRVNLVAALGTLSAALAGTRAVLEDLANLSPGAKATSRLLDALPDAGLSRAYALLLQGDLTPLTSDYRVGSWEGETATAGSDVATSLNPRLTPLDRQALMSVEQRGVR